jgi:hypothetical protein
VHVEVFAPPSGEARRLVRWLGWLVAPPDGTPRWFHRTFGFFCIAPFTQLTFVSFELQAFLHNVFHTSLIARLGHILFMPAVNFFVMVALAGIRPSPAVGHAWPGPGINGATLYACVLLAWYLLIARTQRLYTLWVVMVPITVSLAWGADWYYCHTTTPGPHPWYAPTPLAFNPFLWMGVSAFLVAASHGAEPQLPPRFASQWRWVPLKDFILGPAGAQFGPGRVLFRVAYTGVQLMSGAFNEWWASPRLMPYNILVLLFRVGYRPELRAVLQSHADRALAGGNPAVDFVGTGGGAYLHPRAAASQLHSTLGGGVTACR